MLQHKYAARYFDEIIGNDVVVDSLVERLNRYEDKPHTFLITGREGCGKTNIAELIRKHVKCDDIDYREINASSDRGIGNIRDIAESLRYHPHGESRVIFFDECHGLTSDAQEALLQIMDKPNERNYFIFATTDPQQLKPTFKRRCSAIELGLVDDELLKEYLMEICDEEKVKVHDAVLSRITEMSNGSTGVALGLLDTVYKISDSKEALSLLQKTLDDDSFNMICKWLINPSSGSYVGLCSLLKKLKGDPVAIRNRIMFYMQKVILNKCDAGALHVMLSIPPVKDISIMPDLTSALIGSYVDRG